MWNIPVEADRRLVEAVLITAAGHQRAHEAQRQVETVGAQLQQGLHTGILLHQSQPKGTVPYIYCENSLQISVVDPDPDPKLSAGSGIINFGSGSDKLQSSMTKIA